jgi:tetratricopeptide (TPR) repeat protein
MVQTVSDIDPYELFVAGMERKSASRFASAVPLFEDAIKLAGRDREFRLDCLFALADTFRMVGDFLAASKNYRAAEKLAKSLNMNERAVDASVGLALSLRARGEFKETIILLNKALRKYRSSDDQLAIAFTIWARAGAYRVKGDTKGALKGFGESRTLFTKLKDRSGVGYSLTGLGGASRVAGDFSASKRYYSMANKLFREIRDTFGIAYSYCGLANALRMKGNFKEAGEYFKRAKTNYKRIGDKVSYAYTLWGEGSLYQQTGKRALSKRDFLEAALLFKETGDKRGLVYCELGYGQNEFLAGDVKKALRRIKMALKQAEKLALKTEAGYARELIGAINNRPEAMPLNLP